MLRYKVDHKSFTKHFWDISWQHDVNPASYKDDQPFIIHRLSGGEVKVFYDGLLLFEEKLPKKFLDAALADAYLTP